jgi:hypothetical protein
MSLTQKLASLAHSFSDARAALRHELDITATNYDNLTELLGPKAHRLLQVEGQSPLIVATCEFKGRHFITLLRYHQENGTSEFQAQIVFQERHGRAWPIYYKSENPEREYATSRLARSFGQAFSQVPIKPKLTNELDGIVAVWWADLKTGGYFDQARKLNMAHLATKIPARNTKEVRELGLGDVRATICTKTEHANGKLDHTIELFAIRPDCVGTLRPSHVFKPGDLQNLLHVIDAIQRTPLNESPAQTRQTVQKESPTKRIQLA